MFYGGKGAALVQHSRNVTKCCSLLTSCSSLASVFQVSEDLSVLHIVLYKEVSFSLGHQANCWCQVLFVRPHKARLHSPWGDDQR